jgi:hypothetical protein
LLDDGVAAFPTDKRLLAKSVGTELGLARLEFNVGRLTQARDRSARSMRRLRELAALDPSNKRWREYQVIGELDIVDFTTWSEDAEKAQQARSAASRSLARFRGEEQGAIWRADFEGRLERQGIVLALRAGDEAKAVRLAKGLLQSLKSAPTGQDAAVDRSDLLGFAQLAAGEPSAAIATLSPRQGSLTPTSLDVLARAYLAAGRKPEALRIARMLSKQGYAHPGFVAFWADSLSGGNVARKPVE